MDSRGYLTINASQPLGHGELSFGLGALAWTHDQGDDAITATLNGAVGLHLGPLALELGASLPLSIVNVDDVGVQGRGNAGLHLKTRLVRSSLVGVALVGSVYLPASDAVLGAREVSPQVIGVVDKELGRLRVALNGGVRLRDQAVPLGVAVAYAIKPAKLDLVGEVVGAMHAEDAPREAIGGVKLYLARNSFLSLGGARGLGTRPEVRAFIGIVFEPRTGDRDGDGLKDDVDRCPDEPEDVDAFEDDDGCPDPDNDRDLIVDIDDRCPLIPEDRDGVQDEDGCPEGDANDRDDDGILDPVDGCPDDPEDSDGYEDADGCPDLDNDHDRLLDVDDLCPNAPEDVDGFEDEDGCPDLDNDKDRILDGDDRCVSEPETYNGKDDQDGCPDRDGLTELTDGAVVILKAINFKLDADEILPSSFPVLDAVVASLQGNPDIELVEIQGHTDEQGSDAHNLDLSDRRAASVVRYLTSKGVDAQRLASQGYGESQPKVRTHTQAAYATNRRVEFVILRRAK